MLNMIMVRIRFGSVRSNMAASTASRFWFNAHAAHAKGPQEKRMGCRKAVAKMMRMMSAAMKTIGIQHAG